MSWLGACTWCRYPCHGDSSPILSSGVWCIGVIPSFQNSLRHPRAYVAFLGKLLMIFAFCAVLRFCNSIPLPSGYRSFPVASFSMKWSHMCFHDASPGARYLCTQCAFTPSTYIDHSCMLSPPSSFGPIAVPAADHFLIRFALLVAVPSSSVPISSVGSLENPSMSASRCTAARVIFVWSIVYT